MNFTEALSGIYRANPCQVLPNALWKTLAKLDGYQTSFRFTNGAISHLQIWRNNELFLYWDSDRTVLSQIPPQLWDTLTFALLHHDYASQIPFIGFNSQQYFRLINRSLIFSHNDLVPGFEFVKVNLQREIIEVSNFIDACYPNITPTEEMVRSWTRHPTYEPDLWIWVVDKDRNTHAALGIAEFDKTIREGSLEWIQVHPEYRRKGLGKSIVLRLLQDLNGRAEFATVSGRVDNPARPDLLYRQCGFNGDDIWYVLGAT